MNRGAVAQAMWQAELKEAGVSDRAVSARTLAAFAEESEATRAKWHKLADAAIPAMGSGVKPLEWIGEFAEYTDTPFGGYSLTGYMGDDFDWHGWSFSSRGDCDVSEGWFETQDEARASAQADYEKRILSALTPAPVSVEGLERLREIEAAAKFLVDRLVAYEADGCQCDQSVREWCGHVTPALARMQAFWINDRATPPQEEGV